MDSPLTEKMIRYKDTSRNVNEKDREETVGWVEGSERVYKFL